MWRKEKSMAEQAQGKIPRLNQCFLCKAWALEDELRLIEVPDQVGYIQRSACEKCLGAILKKGG
jgi:hypothetical protein